LIWRAIESTESTAERSLLLLGARRVRGSDVRGERDGDGPLPPSQSRDFALHGIL